MSKHISISDEVYRKLKREKGDRSFSEVIESKLKTGGKLAEVSGQQIFEPGTRETVEENIGQLSEGARDQLDDGKH